MSVGTSVVVDLRRHISREGWRKGSRQPLRGPCAWDLPVLQVPSRAVQRQVLDRFESEGQVYRKLPRNLLSHFLVIPIFLSSSSLAVREHL